MQLIERDIPLCNLQPIKCDNCKKYYIDEIVEFKTYSRSICSECKSYNYNSLINGE